MRTRGHSTPKRASRAPRKGVVCGWFVVLLTDARSGQNERGYAEQYQHGDSVVQSNQWQRSVASHRCETNLIHVGRAQVPCFPAAHLW